MWKRKNLETSIGISGLYFLSAWKPRHYRILFSIFLMVFTLILAACNAKKVAPRVISPQEALGMLKNDFGILVNIDSEPPTDSGNRSLILFSTENSNREKLNSIANQWAESGKKILLLGGEPAEWQSLQLPLKEGRLPNQ